MATQAELLDTMKQNLQKVEEIADLLGDGYRQEKAYKLQIKNIKEEYMEEPARGRGQRGKGKAKAASSTSAPAKPKATKATKAKATKAK